MTSSPHHSYMAKCLELAKQGLGRVSPNPLVGALIVVDDEIVGSGFHEYFGGPHAEINAIESVQNKSLLQNATLYINLEPCSHTGKTPPCVDEILRVDIPTVVFGMLDPNPKVSGSGRRKLEEGGIRVISPLLESECLELNKRFVVNQTAKRPYVILKWAETADGFIARGDGTSKWISSEESRTLVHLMRREEDAILVGTNTALIDNPRLNVRLVEGRNPSRIFLDRSIRIPKSHHLFDGSQQTFCLTATASPPPSSNVTFLETQFDDAFWKNALHALYQQNIGSIIVEGGLHTLQSLVDDNLWDEARIFRSLKKFGEGISAPQLDTDKATLHQIGEDQLLVLQNGIRELPTLQP